MAGQEIEVGAVRPDELDTMLGIMCEAFGLPYTPARDVFYADPYFDIQNKRVLRVGGRVVSCLTIIEADCWVGAGIVRLGGIAGVATQPEERRKGYAARLLNETIPTLKARGYALTGLIPFSHAYYRKFGWELAEVVHRVRIVPAHLPAFPEAQEVRSVQREDAWQLEQLYAEKAQHRTLYCLRDKKRWRFLLDHVKQGMVYTPDRQTVEGYLLYEYRAAPLREGQPLLPGGTSSPTLRILEMLAATPAARRGLIGHLAAQTSAGEIEYAAGAEELTHSGLLNPTQALTGENALANVEILSGTMIRLLDLQRLAESLYANWNGFSGTVALTVHDALSIPDTTSVVIAGTGDSVRVLPAAPGRINHRDQIEGDVRIWSQVAVGYLSAEDACSLGLLRFTTPRARALAAELFPRRHPYLPIPDHF